MSDGRMLGDNGGASRLERQARLLLRAYPPGYRADRGEEIAGTLLEATPPGRAWLPARDAASVIAGGLRARTEANLRQGAAAGLRQAAFLGLSLYLAGRAADALSTYGSFAMFSARSAEGWTRWTAPWHLLAEGVLMTAALVAAWSGRRRLTAAAAAAVIAIYAYIEGSWILQNHHGLPINPSLTGVAVDLSALLLQFAVLTLLTRRADRPPRSLRWLPGLVIGAPVLGGLAFWLRLAPVVHALYWLGGWAEPWPHTNPRFPLIMAAACACWLVTDYRPLTGLAVGFTLTHLPNTLSFGHSWEELAGTAAPLTAAVVLGWRLRSRTRTRPPATG